MVERNLISLGSACLKEKMLPGEPDIFALILYELEDNLPVKKRFNPENSATMLLS